jgi:hypothetical protein|tara:strand:+ start:120 stop:311 length:192 start_codon:yes stop_codon:yes gene_type:complete
MNKTSAILAQLLKAHNSLNETIDFLNKCEDSKEIVTLAKLAEKSVDQLLVEFHNAKTLKARIK